MESFRAIAGLATWERRRARRRTTGPWRPAWPGLAADRTSFGADASPLGPRDGGGGRGPRTLAEFESLELVRAAGVPTIEAVRAGDVAEAVAAARRFGGAVALKLDATGLAHKSDIGGVLLGLAGDDSVRAAAERLLESGRRRGLEVRGLLVQPMAAPGLELLVGVRRDPLFGPVVVVGLGGTLTEILDDVVIRLAPIGEVEADAMLDELRGARLLAGVRGGEAVDRAAVAALIGALGRLVTERPDVLEVDLNPVVATAAGAVAVDALVVLEDTDDA